MHNNFLKKYYFINKFDPGHLIKLSKYVSIIYRNYNEKNDEKLIIKIREFCRKNNKKLFLSNNFKMAIKLDLDGVYLPSFNNEIITNLYPLKKKFKILGSAHNLKQITQKQKQNVSEIFLSSLYKSKESYLGFNKFNKLSKIANVNIIALGGINQKNIKSLNLLNVRGFAAISYFEQKKTAP
tara:strand:+ start:1900 stop:2445 length:546 start_codon:yes stop_codon:yes gene_type:complete